MLESNRQHLTSQRAERDLGVTLRTQTIADEAAWYRIHGMLPGRRLTVTATRVLAAPIQTAASA